MARYELARTADRDIEDIYLYTVTTFGVAQADPYLDALSDCFLQLAQTPNIARRMDELRPGYFRFDHAKHAIMFIKIPDGVRIMRVLHQRMDLRRHL